MDFESKIIVKIIVMSISSLLPELDSKTIEIAKPDDEEHKPTRSILDENGESMNFENEQDNSTLEKVKENLIRNTDAQILAELNTKIPLPVSNESQELYISSPDNEIRTQTSDIFNPRSFRSSKPKKYFSEYTTIIKTQKHFHFLMDRWMKKRLAHIADSEIDLKPHNIEAIDSVPKIEAAPFPLLPSKFEIKAIIRSLDNEIAIERRKLKQFKKSQKNRTNLNQPITNIELKKGIRIIAGNVVAENTFKQVIEQNLQKTKQSHQVNLLSKQKIAGKYKRVGDLPQFFMDASPFIAPILNYLIQRKVAENKYNRQLTNHYVSIRQEYENYSEAVSDYHKLYQRAVDEWPPEFKLSTLRPTELSQVQPFCAPDVIQYKQQEEAECYLYYDENRLVSDPVKEHDAFKHRLIWTEDEKKIFYEKYAQHPREFKKIANALPGKCTKDVIEFYFLNRKPMNLHELDMKARTKGQHKKVISEGGSK